MRKLVHVGYAHLYNDVRILRKECSSLAQAGYNVLYITSDKNGFADVDRFNNVEIRIIRLIDKRFLRLIHYFMDLKHALLKEKADVYHIHEGILLPIASMLCRRGKTVVYDMHEDTSEDLGRYFDRFGKKIGQMARKLIERYERKTVNKCKGFIYVTPGFAQMANVKVPSAMIPNYPLLGNENIDKSFEEYLACNRTVCFAGGIGIIWNHENVLSAMQSFDDAKYLLAGACSPTYMESLKKNRGWRNVTYFGRISFERVQELYAGAAVGMALLAPMLGEKNKEGTLGNTKIFEFMQAGLPIVCTNFSLWKSIVDKYNCGIVVDPNNVEEIVSALKYLFEHPKEAYAMGQRAKGAIEEEYNWENEEIELKKLYKQLLGGENV